MQSALRNLETDHSSHSSDSFLVCWAAKNGMEMDEIGTSDNPKKKYEKR